VAVVSRRVADSPPVSEVVAVPVTVSVPTLRDVEVAFVVVELSAVKFCRVELPVARILAEVSKEFMKALVPFNDVAKKLVEVDCVVVELSAVKFCRVEEPVVRMLPAVRSDETKALV
jgi:hypothetical protein